MEVDLGGLDLAGVMTGALQEGDRLQGQYCSIKYSFSAMIMTLTIKFPENVPLLGIGGLHISIL